MLRNRAYVWWKNIGISSVQLANHWCELAREARGFLLLWLQTTFTYVFTRERPMYYLTYMNLHVFIEVIYKAKTGQSQVSNRLVKHECLRKSPKICRGNWNISTIRSVESLKEKQTSALAISAKRENRPICVGHWRWAEPISKYCSMGSVICLRHFRRQSSHS